MTLSPTLKNLFLIAAKHAVNAAILSAVQIYHDPVDNNFHTLHGFYGVLWTLGSSIGAREVSTFLPKILAWSQKVPPTIVMLVVFFVLYSLRGLLK